MVVKGPEIHSDIAQSLLKALPFDQRVPEPLRFGLNAHGRAEAEQHAVVIELESQILRHHVTTLTTLTTQTATGLEQNDHQLIPGYGQWQRVHVTTELGEQLAVNRHLS